MHRVNRVEIGLDILRRHPAEADFPQNAALVLESHGKGVHRLYGRRRQAALLPALLCPLLLHILHCPVDQLLPAELDLRLIRTLRGSAFSKAARLDLTVLKIGILGQDAACCEKLHAV